MASAVRFDKQLRPDHAVVHRGERAFDRVRGPQMLPVLGGKVIEGQ